MTDPVDPGSATDPEEGGPDERVAIVFIHGQGQQRPMVDVQELARTMWDADPHLRRKSPGNPNGDYARTFTVPDARLGGADFARVTTEHGHYRKRLDFFELYWADLMEGNRLDHLLGWYIRLQRRPRADAPVELLPIRQFAIRACEALLLLGLIAAFAAAMLVPYDGGSSFAKYFFRGPSWSIDWVLAALSLAGIVGIAANIVWNEIDGLPSTAKTYTTPDQLRRLTRRQTAGAWWTFGLALAIFVAVFAAAIVRGPTADITDLCLLLFLLITAACLLVLWQRANLIGATMIAIVAGLIASALVLGNFASHGASDSDLIRKGFGDQAIAAKWVLTTLTALVLFAALWALTGLSKIVTQESQAGKRAGVTFVALAISAVAGAFILWGDTADVPFLWLAYSAGIALWVASISIGIALAIASRAFLIPVMADAARYFSRDPEQIQARQKIRARGVQLLDQLHALSVEEGGYNRIIVIAHSLGSVVGYELLTDYWARQADQVSVADNSPLAQRLLACEAAGLALAPPTGSGYASPPPVLMEAFQQAQAGVADLLAAGCDRTNGVVHNAPELPKTWRWLVTDFITLGSPLIHANVLMADRRAEFEAKKTSRELSVCPPIPATPPSSSQIQASPAPTGKHSDAYTYPSRPGERKLVHSAVFAAVRWTNLYFVPGRLILEGDPISGPIGAQFGCGIQDIALSRADTGMVFAHNEYWRSQLPTEELRTAFREPENAPVHLVKLKEALRIVSKGQTTRSLAKRPF